MPTATSPPPASTPTATRDLALPPRPACHQRSREGKKAKAEGDDTAGDDDLAAARKAKREQVKSLRSKLLKFVQGRRRVAVRSAGSRS